MDHSTPRHAHATKSRPYRDLGVMTVLSFAAMYALMYAMVDSASNVYNNLNQVYMAALMTAPMVAIELLVMRKMYQDAGLNRLVIAGTTVIALGAFLSIRQQSAVGDQQFLRSMIPHHAAAILMCEQAPIADAEIRALCQQIMSSQQREILAMKAKLAQLE